MFLIDIGVIISRVTNSEDGKVNGKKTWFISMESGESLHVNLQNHSIKKQNL